MNSAIYKYRLHNSLFKGLGLIIFAILLSCNPTKKIPQGEYLLKKNKIKQNTTGVDDADISSYIKQKPNKTILGFIRFHLGLYNMVNEDRMRRRKAIKDAKIDKKNLARAAKGKKLKSKDKLTFREWLMDVGEAPIVLDSMLVKKSSRQISLFLENKGYFNNTVTDTIIKGRKKASVHYTIHAGQPYKIKNIKYRIEDENLTDIIFSDTADCLIKKNKIFNVDNFEKERARITARLNNDGYYYFEKEFIYFKIDTNLNSNQANVIIGVKKFLTPSTEKADSFITSPHQKYYLNNIYVQPNYDPKSFLKTSHDTLVYDNLSFLYNKNIAFKPKALSSAIFLRPNNLYQKQNGDDSYKRLSELRAFKVININYAENRSKPNTLDCIIQLSPVLKQSFSLEAQGTNTQGNLGVAGSFIYQNKNMFRGAEIFEIKLRGGIEAQKLLSDTKESDIKPLLPFNTVEFGPEVSLNIPRFLVPFNVKASKKSNPKTTISTSYIFQQRPDYVRSILNLSYGYSWKETEKKRHFIYPIEISSVKVNLNDNFAQKILSTNDLLLLNSFTNHFATSTRYVFLYNEQSLNKNKSFGFFKGSAESSGNILRGIDNLSGKTKNDVGSYDLLGITYSQYLRADIDFRYYLILNEQNKIVFRAAGGVGKPLHNLRVLPFEKSFFAGGANSLRAWRARTLGPGGFSDLNTNSFDRIGDALLEGNVEYRFKLIKALNGALFMDAGNIWLRKPYTNRPGGEFDINRFYNEFAVDGGIGARMDFTFFVIRLDLGIKLRDPVFDDGERWVGQHLFDADWKDNFFNKYNERYSFLNLNLGIGYPF